MTKTKNIGTAQYQAPELVLSGKYDEKVDIFSFAILAYVMISLNFDPFNSKKISGNVAIKISTEPSFRPDVKKLPIEVPKWLVDLLVKSWDHEPSVRPAFTEICSVFKKNLKVENMEIFAEKQMRNPVTIYVMRDGEGDETEAIDVELKVFKIEELKRIGLECEKVKDNEEFKIFVKINDELVEIVNDEDMKLVQNDVIIIFKT